VRTSSSPRSATGRRPRRFQENLSRKNVRAEVEGSLDRLGTDYLDILYLHRFDDGTPIERTLRTLDDLVSEGKVNYIGISTCDAWKLTKGLWQADVNNYEAFTVTQPEYSAVYRDPIVDDLDQAPEHKGADRGVPGRLRGSGPGGLSLLAAPRRLPHGQVRARRR